MKPSTFAAIIASLFLSAMVLSQSTSILAPTAAVNNSGAASTRPMKSGTADPGTCAQGEFFYRTDTKSTRACTATNTWGDVAASSSFELANEAGTGTTANKLVKLTGAPSTGIVTATTDVTGAVGIVLSGAGTSGNATIVSVGIASCVFDGATTAGDYVTISSSVAGDCHDFAPYKPFSQQVIGRVLTTNGGGGTYQILLYGGEPSASAPQPATLPTFSWDNQNGSTATLSGGTERLQCASDTNAIHLRYTTAPAAPYTLTARIKNDWTMEPGDDRGGLAFRKSSDGKIVAMHIAKNGSETPYVAISKWTTSTSFSADYYLNSTANFWDPLVRYGPDICLRIRDNNTNLSFWYSLDCVFYDQMDIDRARTDFMAGGPDQIGYHAGSTQSGGNAPATTLLSWTVTQP